MQHSNNKRCTTACRSAESLEFVLRNGYKANLCSPPETAFDCGKPARRPAFAIDSKVLVSERRGFISCFSVFTATFDGLPSLLHTSRMRQPVIYVDGSTFRSHSRFCTAPHFAFFDSVTRAGFDPTDYFCTISILTGLSNVLCPSLRSCRHQSNHRRTSACMSLL